MNSVVLGLFAFVAFASAGHLHLYPSHSTLVRTPALDSSVVHSERLGGAFSYSTSENHAYAPVVHSVPVVQTYSVYPQAYYPAVQTIYPAQHPVYVGQQPVYSIYPSYYPTLSGIPLPGAPGLPAPGVNPQNPIEVEDPADNTQNENLQQQQNNGDDDTVSVDSA